MYRGILIFAFSLFHYFSYAQFNWKLEKDKENIKVYTSPSPNSSIKAVRVEASFQGNYTKLISILNDPERFDEWIYKTKRSTLLKRNSRNDFLYYSETSMPFPLDNRDVVLHVTINTDSLPKFLLINGRNEDDVIPEVHFRVRVPHYSASWKITMPSANQIHISYILDLDPGGSIPSSLINIFVDKGPYETFKNLEKELQKIK